MLFIVVRFLKMSKYYDRIFKIGKTEKRIYEKLESDGFVYFVLVDPEKPGDLVSLSKIAQELGVTAIMVGGSTAQLSIDYEEVISKIKHESSIPVIIFPSGTASIARGADAIWFMSLLNSDDLFYVIGAQYLGIGAIRSLRLEPIPLAYIIVGYGGTVGFVGRARPIPYERPELAAGYAMAAEALGFRFVYFEGGSGAPRHIPPEFISYVRRFVSIPIIVGGGITNGAIAKELIAAGADGIVTGNVLEGYSQIKDKILDIMQGCKEGAKDKLNKINK